MKSLRAKPIRFNGGEHVRDVITGFSGVITGMARYITGCDQYLVAPQSTDGKAAESHWFDAHRLEIGDLGKSISVSDAVDGEDDGACGSAPIK